jgi:hypothetical protein
VKLWLLLDKELDMKRILLLILFVISQISFQLFGDCGGRYQNNIVFDKVELTANIQYGRAQNSNGQFRNLLFDFYEPNGDGTNIRPLLIFLHGGAFIGGDKDIPEAAYPCHDLALRGYATASIQYRLEDDPLALFAPEAMIKAVIRCVHDIKASVRFFYKQAKEEGNPFRIDTNNIFIGGVSAGSIAAIHAAYMDDIEELDVEYRKYVYIMGGLEGESGNPGYSSKVKGVLNLCGAIRDRDYVNNNTNIPILSIHHNNDLSVSPNFGRPYGIPTLPSIAGSYVMARHFDNIGMYNMLYRVPGTGHVPHTDGTRKKPYYDSTLWYMSTFMYSLLDCNPDRYITSVFNQYKPAVLNLHPNPTSGIFRWNEVAQDTLAFDKIRVVDMMGITRGEFYYKGTADLPDLRSMKLQNGVYFIQGMDNEGHLRAQGRIVFNK